MCNAQCVIDTPNTQVGFTPQASAPVAVGSAISQTTQIYVMPSAYYQGNLVVIDSLHFATVTGLPTGVTYAFNTASGTVAGGGIGVKLSVQKAL